MKRTLFATTLLSACVIAAPAVAVAAETDYSYLEDMSVKELRELDSHIHELLGDTGASAETEAATEAETEVAPVHMTEDEFFEDILASYTARNDFNAKYSAAELDAMTYEEFVTERKVVVGTEKWFADKYENAVFDDLNIQYLCKQYVQGLQKQIRACDQYLSSEKKSEDYDQWHNAWFSGYYNRCYVIVELSEYFSVPFPAKAVATMKEDASALESTAEAETRNSEVPHETVKEVQTLLDAIGFKCWNIDGVAGKRTVKAIKRFQEMYGYEVDGMITDELIGQLKQVMADKGLGGDVEPETEA